LPALPQLQQLERLLLFQLPPLLAFFVVVVVVVVVVTHKYDETMRFWRHSRGKSVLS